MAIHSQTSKETVTINIIETIGIIDKTMATTITIHESTKARLDDYKMGRKTYDELLNSFMDEIDIEDIAKEHIKEHYRRLENFDGIPADEFIRQVKAEREK